MADHECDRPGCDDPTPPCVLCSVLRSGRVNHVETPQACGDCRLRLAAIPTDIADAHALLEDLLEPRRGNSDARHATAEAPIPLSIDPYDLLADHCIPEGPIRRARLAAHAQDQIGHLPVAVTLDGWLRDWAELRDLGEASHPDRTVAGICVWLAERTPWACDHHPAVDDYATEVQELRGTLLALVGRVEPDERPQRIPGVPCPRCRHVTLLRRVDGWTECGWPDCMSVFSPDDYARVTRAVAGAVRRGLIEVA